MPDRPVSSATASLPLRVVIADDDATIRGVYSEFLTLVPHLEVVGEAADGSEAVELVQRAEPGLVLLDVEMPRMDGVAAAEVIRSYRPQTHILLHSGAASEQKRRQAAALGLPVLDKTAYAKTIEVVAAAEHLLPAEVGRVIEPLVLLALAHHSQEGVLIVAPDGGIPFYNGAGSSSCRCREPSQTRQPPPPRWCVNTPVNCRGASQ
jgi:chemotaxis response regulator CheB